MTVLLTGANGFVGRHVDDALRNAGHRVRSAVRSPDAVTDSEECIVIATDRELADWRKAVEGMGTVIHLAARAHRSPAVQLAEGELYERANVANTADLLRASGAAGVRHFIYLSTAAVNGPTTDGRNPFREDDNPEPLTVYARTKLQAEREIAEIAADREMNFTIIRTPLIYGRGAKGSLALLIRALERGLPLPLAGIENRRAFAAATNVASFILHRMQHGSDSGTFMVADDERISTGAFVRLLASTLGVRSRLFNAPAALISASFRFAGRPDIVESLMHSLEIDTAKARAAGWRPSPMAAAMRASFR